MLKKTLKTRQEVEDFVRGCTFFGTGGGGDYQEVDSDHYVRCHFI